MLQADTSSGEWVIHTVVSARIADLSNVESVRNDLAQGIPLLVALGVRRDGQKVLLAVRNMGGETQAAWRSVLDDLLARGLKAPELLIVDGGKGLEAALASLWSDIAVQRCSVHKERNLGPCPQAPAPSQGRLQRHDVRQGRRGSAQETQGVPGQVAAQVPGRGGQPGRSRRTVVHLPAHPPTNGVRTTNAIERLHEEFKRRIKTNAPCPTRKPRPCCSGR